MTTRSETVRRHLRLGGLVLVVNMVIGSAGLLAQSAEQQIINDAATALGGRERVLSAKSLLVQGGGHDLNVTQSRRWDEMGLQSDVWQIRDYKRAYDLANGRARFEAVREAQYDYYQGEGGAAVVQGLDGNIAFNVNTTGNATRVFASGQIAALRFDFLRHPLTAVRTALDPAVALSHARTQGNERLVDVTTDGLTFTLAIDGATKLPTRVAWMTDSSQLGDHAVETRFTAYRGVSGLQLPTRLSARIDRFASQEIRILQQAIDADVGNLAAPANVSSAAPPPTTRPAPIPIQVEEVAKGIWHLTGQTHHSMLVEFSDHLLLVEAPNEARTLAVLAKAKELRPDKPVTTLLVTHHHSDHTGGVRAAVAEGVTEIITHKSNVAYVQEILTRPHTINPDTLTKNPVSSLPTITAIGDEGVVQDFAMTINLYHILDNTHADSMLLLYFPGARVVTQADVYMPNDKRNIIAGEPLGHAPWNRNVYANVNYRKLQPERMVPIHGEHVPYSQFVESMVLMTQFLPSPD